jgi:hypothetical protein
MSTHHSSVPTTDGRAGEADISPLSGVGDRSGAGAARSLPRHLAPSQRRPGLLRSVASAALLVVVVLAVGVVVVLGSIDRLKHPPPSEARPAVGSPGSSHLAPGAVTTSSPQELLSEGTFEATLGGIRGGQGTRIEVVAGGARSAHSARLSLLRAPAGKVGLLADRVTQAPGPGARYSATVVVRASRPGVAAQIQLVETVGGRLVSSDPQLVQLRDTQWHLIFVQHEITNNGAMLGVEVTFSNVRAGQYAWVDDLKVVQTL